MSIFRSWKFYIIVAFTATIVAKCHPVYATVLLTKAGIL